MMHRVFPIGALVLLAMSGPALATNPAVIVKQAEMAGTNVSYRGIKVASIYFAGRYTTSTLKVLHKKPDKTRTDFFTPTPLAGVIIIQKAEQVWAYSPSLDMWEQRPSQPDYSSDSLHQDLTRNYALKVLGTEQVAGRPAYVIYASPRNTAEPARRIWVDETSYLVMRTQLEDRHGGVLNGSRYIKIEINPNDISPEAFRVTGNIQSRPEPAGVNFKLMVPKYLPPGYRLIATSTITVNGLSCAHLQFSNGTNVVSLFERKGSKPNSIPAPVKSKTTNALTWNHNGMVLTLIGDVNSKELSKIAATLR